MSTFTENYDFIKPDNEDYYDIQDFNENMDAIDAQLAQAEQKAAAIQASIATAEESLAAINKKLGTPPRWAEHFFPAAKRRLGDSLDSVCGIRRTENPFLRRHIDNSGDYTRKNFRYRRTIE